MTSTNCFNTLLLLARPGAGKSEIIDFLKSTPLPERIDKFHVGQIYELDDFPMLWAWFEEDAILEQLGYPRLHTNDTGYFLGHHLWDVLIHRLNLEHQKWQRDYQNHQDCQTAIMEFSRGSEHGGYARAFQHLSSSVAKDAAILFVDVTWEESLRKNRIRFNPDRPDSILQHSMPDWKLEHLYKDIDWQHITRQNPDMIQIQEINVPYVVFDNHDDVTTRKGEALENRLIQSLGRLWELWMKSR